MKSIEEQLILHEGLKLKPYRCTAGYLTIGVGLNLDAGITEEEAIWLAQNRIKRVECELEQFLWYKGLDPVRKKVLVDMCYNIGLGRLLKFRKMIACLGAKDYLGASEEMKDSQWYHQVGQRGKRLVKMMATGEDY